MNMDKGILLTESFEAEKAICKQSTFWWCPEVSLQFAFTKLIVGKNGFHVV